MVQPKTDVRLDHADLEIRSAVGDSIEEPFANLGISARERVAVWTRLTLAEFSMKTADRSSSFRLTDWPTVTMSAFAG